MSDKATSKLAWYVLFGSLMLLLLASVFVMINGWTSMPSVHMSGMGILALVGGVLMSFIIGGGLMALVFYSARNGYDDASQTPFKPGPEKNDTPKK